VTTYSKKSNCIRAARSKLGKTAKPGTDFEITKDGNVFSWKALKKAKAQRNKRAPNGKRSPVIQQAQYVKLLKFIGGAPAKGRTVAECQAEFGNCSSHNIRGMVSRARAEGVKITSGREFKVVHYKLAA